MRKVKEDIDQVDLNIMRAEYAELRTVAWFAASLALILCGAVCYLAVSHFQTLNTIDQICEALPQCSINN